MNTAFAEHVTNTAFFLSISKKQIRYLQVLFLTPWPSRGYYERPFSGTRSDPDNWISSYRALINKGLVVSVQDDPAHNMGHYELTTAGVLTCQLLVEAGLIEDKSTQQAAA